MALKYLYVPSGAKAGKAYGVIPNSANADFSSFVSDTDGTRVDKNGFITDVEANVPRIDYTGGGCPSLLLEPTSTNYFQYSQDFNQSYWQHNADITTTNSSELAPNGGLNANLIEYDGSGYSFIRLYMTVPSTAATLSVFAKKGNWRYLGLRNFQASGNDHTVFDFDTETFSNIASGQTASFEVFPDGWYRIKVTHPSPESNSIVGFAISNSSGSESNTTGGQVANVHLFGAQLEQQAYATSYIPNYGTSAGVTRSQDSSGNTGDLSSVLNTQEGVLFLHTKLLADDNINRAVSFGLDANNYASIQYIPTSNKIYGRYRIGGSFTVQLSHTFDRTIEHKVALKFKENDFSLWLNGVEVDSDTGSVGTSGLFTNVSLSTGGASNANKFYGRLKDLRIYDEVLSDSELQELTTL